MGLMKSLHHFIILTRYDTTAELQTPEHMHFWHVVPWCSFGMTTNPEMKYIYCVAASEVMFECLTFAFAFI